MIYYLKPVAFFGITKLNTLDGFALLFLFINKVYLLIGMVKLCCDLQLKTADYTRLILVNRAIHSFNGY
tara:strand:- start:139 stop:345 length:207 start_codon:yes stop_codon:yes gene_type:complete